MTIAGMLLAGCSGSGGGASPAGGAGSPSGAVTAKPASPGAGASGAPEKVRFGVNSTSSSTTLYWLSQSAGIFAKNGLDVELAPSAGRASLDAVVAGQLDGLAIGGPQTVLIAIQHGAPMHIVAVPSDVYNVIVVAPESITSLDQLKGKRIGGQSETAIDVTGVKRALHDVGLEAGKDYEFVDTGAAASGNGVVAALLAHQIDAAPLDDVTTQVALKQPGFHVLLDMADPNAHIRSAFSAIAFRDNFIQQRGTAAQKMMDSLVQGMAYMRGHKAETEAVIKERTKIDDPAQLESVYARQVQLMAKDPTPASEEFTDAATYVPKGTSAISSSQVAASFDPSFAKNAVAHAG